ncbi:acyl-ACP--UDP-N-acetylglucosamine O-acyltransferase [Thermoproteota archaeon]
MGKIHPTAIISKEAVIDSDVEIGPYSVIEGGVKIAKGTKISKHVTIEGFTEIGQNNTISSGVVIGSPPQDLKYKGGESFLRIGDNNTIREFVTINLGTDKGTTKVGSSSLFMAYSHIAHDCVVGDNCVFANCATLAGHVTVEDRSTIGGLSAIHQFVRVGTLSIIGGCSKVVQDIPPYSTCDGHPASVFGINLIGLRRSGVSKEVILQLKSAFKILFYSGLSFPNAVEKVKKEFPQMSEELGHLVKFVKTTKRGINRQR